MKFLFWNSPSWIGRRHARAGLPLGSISIPLYSIGSAPLKQPEVANTNAGMADSQLKEKNHG